MMVEIRKMNYSDLESVQEINTKNLPENYKMKLYYYILTLYPDLSFVAVDNGLIVGYILIKLEKEDLDINLAYITSLCVDFEYRNRGIGKRLIENGIKAVKNYLKENMSHINSINLILNVRVSNNLAINLYCNKFGFKNTDLIEKYYHNKEDAYRMVLTILPS
ncbi:N-terminal acetyltransferase A complex catalytic subunit ard1 [Hamiltosporidium tvaerminnensis]|nr:N-terminal acetyltransferase A complex catalytic subunit ard1 [Hamiltosporidium tvaerminnensis]